MSADRGDTKYSRRDFLKLAGVTAAATLLPSCDVLGPQLTETDKQIMAWLPEFRGASVAATLSRNEQENSQSIENQIKTAIEQSEQEDKEITITLPEGNVEIDKKINLDVGNARIVLEGNPKGSQLTLKEELSHLPTEWGNNTQNLLELKEIDANGKVVLRNIVFDGGSQKAAKGDYKAPPSPWDAVVFLLGKGQEGIGEPQRDKLGTRGGQVQIENCFFKNSEAPGLLVQNLGEASVKNCQGKNLDCLGCFTFMDNFTADNLTAENCLSDGIYATDCHSGFIDNCQMKTCRQGYDFHGCQQVTMDNSHAYDCAEAFTVSLSKASESPSGKIAMNACGSQGSAIAYALQYCQGFAAFNCFHDNVGKWFGNNDFMHKGIADPGGPAWVNKAVALGENIDNLTFNNVIMRKAQDSMLPEGYQMPNISGIKVIS